MAYLPLDTVKLFVDLFDIIYLRHYDVEKIDFGDDGLSEIYILDKELVLLVNIQKDKRVMPLNAKELFKRRNGRGNEFIHVPQPKENYFVLDIQELTPNGIGFEFVYSKFIRRLETLTNMRPLEFDVDYTRFKGWDRPYWNKEQETTLEQVARQMPELQLRERYKKWQGNKYNFLIIDLNTRGNKYIYAVAYTQASPEDYMKRWAERYMERGTISSNVSNWSEMEKALKTLRAKSRHKRLGRVSYSVITEYFKEKDDVWRRADKLLEQVQAGKLELNEPVPLDAKKPSPRNWWHI